MNRDAEVLREAASELEDSLNGISGVGLQTTITAVSIAVGWLRRRAEKLEIEQPEQKGKE